MDSLSPRLRYKQSHRKLRWWVISALSYFVRGLPKPAAAVLHNITPDIITSNPCSSKEFPCKRNKNEIWRRICVFFLPRQLMQPERGDTAPLAMSHMIGRKGRNKTMYLDMKTMGLQAIRVQWKS